MGAVTMPAPVSQPMVGTQPRVGLQPGAAALARNYGRVIQASRFAPPVSRVGRGEIRPGLPQNRFIQQRTMPIAGGPSMQPTNPNITNPNVSIGVPMQPPSFVIPPPSDSLNAQVITPITNPVTGETYMAPSGGYTLNPNITNPNVSIGMPITGGFDMMPPQLEAMPYTGGPFQARPDLGPNVGFGAGLPGGKSQPAAFGPTSKFGAALGTSSPMLNTVAGGFNPPV